MPASLRAHLARAMTRPYDRRSPAPSSPALSDTNVQLQHPPSPDIDVPSPIVPPPAPAIADRTGMPTYAHYKRLEASYLTGLSPRKRDKALITQAMFDKIWDVLHQPEACSIETPQFRFWVRKMFTLSRPGQRGDDADDGDEDEDEDEIDDEGMGDVGDSEMPTAVVLHENRPVAIMEQLYEVFCYCHERSGHGGRDKTCAVIRQHYSWVPKELTAQFVKGCPTCTIKRSGNSEMVTLNQECHGTTAPTLCSSVSGKIRKSAGDVVEETGASLGWPTTGGPLDPAVPQSCGVEAQGREKEKERERDPRGERFVGGPAPNNFGMHMVPRESPLANPLQEGSRAPLGASSLTNVPVWTLQGVQVGGRSGSKNANTLLPQGHSDENSKTVDRRKKSVSTRIKLPSLSSALSNGSLDCKLDLANLGTENLDDTECLPPVLKPLQVSEPVKQQLPPHFFQIDPVLLAFNYPGSGTAAVPASGADLPPTVFGNHNTSGLDLPPIHTGTPNGIVRNATCMDTLPNLKLGRTSDARTLPFWTDHPSALTNGSGTFGRSRVGLGTGSPLRTLPDRDIDFEMGGLPEMTMDSDSSPDRSTSSVSSSDSPDSSFEYAGTLRTPMTEQGSVFKFPLSFSESKSGSLPVGCVGSRYDYPDSDGGATPFSLGSMSSPTDDVGRELARTLSFPLLKDDLDV